MAKTTTEFITGLKRRITMPANQVLIENDDILDMGSDILRLGMTKILKAARQNYLLTTVDLPIVADQAAYDVPYRSVVNGLEDLKYVYDDGITLKKLAFITVEDIYQYTNSTTYPQAFYFQGDQIILVPIPASATGSLRLPYHRQLSKLCAVEDAGQVLSFTSTTVTLSATPPTSFVAAAEIDFIKSKSLSTILSQDVAIASVGGNVLTFATDDIPSRLAIGDWISLAQTTPIIPIPDECYDYFEGSVGISILKAIGDEEGARALKAEVDDQERDVKSLLEPRIDGEPVKIVNFEGLLRQKTFRYFGR